MDALLLSEEDFAREVNPRTRSVLVDPPADDWNFGSPEGRRALRSFRGAFSFSDKMRRYYWRPFHDQLRHPLPLLPHMPHLSGVSLGTYLGRNGFSAGVIDNFERVPSNQKKLDACLKEDLLAIGLSTNLLMDREHLQDIVADLRSKRPDVPLVLGGATSEWQPWARDLADIVVYGFGEKTLCELLACLKSDGDLSRVPNIAYRQNGGWVSTPRLQNLEPDEILRPDWDLLEVRPSHCYPLETSKGCRYDCAFCSFPERANQRLRSFRLVLDEIVDNHRRHGVTLYRFMDSNFTSWPEKAEALCREIERLGLPLRWSCYARVDNLARHPGLAEAMKRAGCFMVNCGIESGDDGLLRAMHKGYTRDIIRAGIRRAQSAGLMVHGSFIIGFPGETAHTVQRTMDLIDQLGLDTVTFYRLSFLTETDTKLWVRREQLRISGEKDSWAHSTMRSDEAQSHVDACTDRVIRQGGKTVLGTEFQITYFQGWGLEPEEVKAYLVALRDFHVAKRVGAGPPLAASRSVIRRYGTRLYETAFRLGRIEHPASSEWFRGRREKTKVP